MRPALAHINALDKAGFVALLGPLYEHSPWAAERAYAQAPFQDVDALRVAMRGVVDIASRADRLALIQAHPELAGDKLRLRSLTSNSMSEQASRGLDQLGAGELERWAALNIQYRERFGFPFVICVRMHSKPEIIEAMERRLQSNETDERNEAMRQIHDIARLRLDDLVEKLEAQG